MPKGSPYWRHFLYYTTSRRQRFTLKLYFRHSIFIFFASIKARKHQHLFISFYIIQHFRLCNMSPRSGARLAPCSHFSFIKSSAAPGLYRHYHFIIDVFSSAFQANGVMSASLSFRGIFDGVWPSFKAHGLNVMLASMMYTLLNWNSVNFRILELAWPIFWLLFSWLRLAIMGFDAILILYIDNWFIYMPLYFILILQHYAFHAHEIKAIMKGTLPQLHESNSFKSRPLVMLPFGAIDYNHACCFDISRIIKITPNNYNYVYWCRHKNFSSSNVASFRAVVIILSFYLSSIMSFRTAIVWVENFSFIYIKHYCSLTIIISSFRFYCCLARAFVAFIFVRLDSMSEWLHCGVALRFIAGVSGFNRPVDSMPTRCQTHI